MPTLISPLSNFNCAAPLRLDSDIEIHTLLTSMTPILDAAKKDGVIRHPANYTHLLVIRNAIVERDDRVDAKEILEEAILRLRLFKPGSIGFNFAMIDRDGWYDQLYRPGKVQVKYEQIGVFFYVVWDQPGIPSAYEILSEDIGQLQELFEVTRGQKLLQKPSFRFFFRGYHEPYASDRFLRNAIALENLLVNDTNDQSNVTYKFVDRGCYLLNRAQPHANGASEYAPLLKKIYDARSAAVHSNKHSKRDWDSPTEIELLQKSEEFARTLLVHILRNPEMGDSIAIDLAKRQKY